MHTHIDWLSFTLDSPNEPVESTDLYYIAKGLFNGQQTALGKRIFDSRNFSPCLSRAPYRFAIQDESHGIRIFGGSHSGTVLFELTGIGCSGICEDDNEASDVYELSERVTRIDIATDVEHPVKPTDFCGGSDTQRFRSRSIITSDTGETVYIGSPKSDRYCRVYRYNPPHPRAALLRCEFVFRRQLAKDAARQFAPISGRQEFVARLGNTFGFTHAAWEPDVTTSQKVKVQTVTRQNEGSVYWVYSQVIPALRRLHTEGALYYSDFLKELFS